MAEAALERLREAIIMGELTPGTPLRLEDLARNLGMSISPIREAVRQLGALAVAAPPDPPGVGLVRALPPCAAREGRAPGPARGAGRRARHGMRGARRRARGEGAARPSRARGRHLRGRARRALDLRVLTA